MLDKNISLFLSDMFYFPSRGLNYKYFFIFFCILYVLLSECINKIFKLFIIKDEKSLHETFSFIRKIEEIFDNLFNGKKLRYQ